MIKRFVQLFVVAAIVFAAPVQAVRRYSCNFEDSIARSRWKLNPTANQSIYNQLANKWYIGEPGNNDRNGQYGLYISDDGGATAHYQNKGCWVFAYDTVALDNIAGDYMLTFDYTSMANVASNFDGLYALWIPMTNEDGDSIKVNSVATSGLPGRYKNYVIRLQPNANMDYLAGTVTWRQCAVKIPGSKCDGKPHYLAFVWANGAYLPQQPGALIDNILITDGAPCDQPTNLVVTPNGTTVSLEWQGTATEYEVSAYSYDGQVWAGPKIVTGTQTNFTGLPVGQTDFIVRAKCGDDYFSLKTIVSKLIYYPDQMCVDYLNLNNAKCYVANSQPSDTRTFSDFRLVNAVDYGPANSSSRHTVHFDRTEVEARTANMAKTIPDGELASVRLGNWENETGEGAEQIEFSFPIDTIKYPVLLLKYLPIIEAPNHTDAENSRFTLDILVDGQSIGRCGQADFNANDAYNTETHQLKPGAAQQGWHLVPPGSFEGSTTPVVWKEWTTVGVNIKQYAGHGSTITARLATYDCVYNAHFGYAYFTLGCSDGKLKGMKCGAINPEFEAPDGFHYRWAYAYNEKYRRPDGSLPDQYILSTDQHYSAGMHDDSLYVVDCMFVQDHSCFFSLYASTLATNPISVMNDPQIYMNCRDSIYRVTFDASPSWVQEIDHVTGDTLVSKAYHIETYEWNIEGLAYGWSDEVSPTFDFPIEGGDYEVTLRTTCGTCDSVLHYHLHLDPLGATKETQTYILCDDDRKAGFVWKERTDTAYHTYGVVDSVVLLNPATTCDSVIYLELTEPVRLLADTVVLSDDLPFVYRGRSYTESVIDTIPNAACDTTWVLNFEVYEPLKAHLADTAIIVCEDDSVVGIEYIITQGRSLRYSYRIADLDSIDSQTKHQRKGTDTTLVVPLAKPYPNIYKGSLLLEDSLPEHNVRLPFTVTIRYASSIITQRWNDVLAIRNADYNGGYLFTAVQWYLGESPIQGATEFNYFAGENAQLRFGEPYSALLTRDDGVQLFTCPIEPEKVSADITDMPTLVPLGSSIQVQGKGKAYWYDVLGRPHHTESYDNSSISAPTTAGYYLLVLRASDTNAPKPRTIHPMMVR